MSTYTWALPPESESVTEFELEKSTDGGLTFAALATIPNDTTNAAVFNPDTCKFFYVDGSPVAGEIVRIAAENANGLGPWEYLHGPPAVPTLCNIYGAVLDMATGKPVHGCQVLIEPIAAHLSSYQQNAGVASLNAESVTVSRRALTIFTDAAGRWQIDLMQDLPVRISIPKVGVEQIFRVPKNVATLNFRDAVKYRISGPIFPGKSSGTGAADGPLGVAVHTP